VDDALSPLRVARGVVGSGDAEDGADALEEGADAQAGAVPAVTAL